MPQRKSSLYNLINNPLVYKIIQKLMSGTSFRANIVRKNIKKKNSKILDIGDVNIMDMILTQDQ